MAKQRTQADYRRSLNPRDQFGRKWSMEIEIATGDPTGGIFPAGWTDPLRTPMKYLKVPRNEDGQAEIGKLRVEFPHWIAEQEESERAWYHQLHANARTVYKKIDKGDAKDLERDPFLVELTGSKPWPSVPVLKRAMAGDKGLLGLSILTQQDRVDLGMETVEDLKAGAQIPEASSPRPDDLTPPDAYPAFVGWAFRTGAAPKGDLKAAAELWATHRKNLQAA
jgi:hypothetical protein